MFANNDAQRLEVITSQYLVSPQQSDTSTQFKTDSPESSLIHNATNNDNDGVISSSNILTPMRSFCGGLLVGGVAARCLWPHRHYLWTWFFSSRRHAAAGFRCGGQIVPLHRDGFSLGYHLQRRHPMWASFYLCRFSSVQFADPRYGDNFVVDEDLPEMARSYPSDYVNSGYDKGHLVPSRSMRFTASAAQQTFFMSNIAPQLPVINRGVWKSVESDTRKWAQLRGKLAVVVGCIHSLEHPRCVKGKVAIPTSFYMAITHCRTGNCIGFHIPNTEEAAEVAEKSQLQGKFQWEPFVVSIDALSKDHVGDEIFGLLPRWQRPRKEQRKAVALEFWQNGIR